MQSNQRGGENFARLVLIINRASAARNDSFFNRRFPQPRNSQPEKPSTFPPKRPIASDALSSDASDLSFLTGLAVMPLLLFQVIRSGFSVLSETAEPKPLAAGVALGLLLGLLPLHNLTAVVVMTIIFCLRVNLPLVLLSAFLTSFAHPWIDPWADCLGYELLSLAELQASWSWLFRQPFLAWTALNDTLVLGNLVIGLLTVYPLYRIFAPIFEFIVPHLTKAMERLRLAFWMDSLEAAAKESQS